MLASLEEKKNGASPSLNRNHPDDPMGDRIWFDFSHLLLSDDQLERKITELAFRRCEMRIPDRCAAARVLADLMAIRNQPIGSVFFYMDSIFLGAPAWWDICPVAVYRIEDTLRPRCEFR